MYIGCLSTNTSKTELKGSDWQCMAVELRMWYRGDIFQDSFETYKTFK